MKMSHRSPTTSRRFPVLALLLLSFARVEGGADVDPSRTSIGSEVHSYVDESVHRKREHHRRTAQNLFSAEAGGGSSSSQQTYGDVRNKYRIDVGSGDEGVGNNGTAHSSKVMPDLRIINGVSAPETRYPYSASLQYNNQHFCGGALVSPNIVITAAHCTSTPTKITLGRYDLDSPYDYDYEVLDVLEKVVHPDYDKTVVENDLALLILERDSVHPYIRINDRDSVPSDGEELAVMGWGDVDSSEHGQKTSDELRETDVWYMTNSKCEQSEGYVKVDGQVLFGSYEAAISSTMMCAIDNIGTTSDACQGDSGGALVKTGSDSNYDVLVGLVSWGFGCADPNFPGVYCRLSAYYYDFLQPSLCKYSLTPPSYLGCTIVGGMGPIPTPSPVAMPKGLLTIFVVTDPFSPEDLGWELTSVPGGEIIASRSIGHYANKYQATLSEQVVVRPERFYRLTLLDRDRDGFRGEVTVVRGTRYVKSDALVHEPGFSSVSGGSVVHGFYVGDSPPRVLTLELTFDKNPEDLAWSVTNVEDDLPLSFKWFDWYGKGFIKATETISIYGGERGTQQYIFTVLDLYGNGMCCDQGQGSFSLYLGESSSENLIATGGKFTTDQSFTFEVNSAGLVSPITPTATPTQKPTSYSVGPPEYGFYMSTSTGICEINDKSHSFWIGKTFSTYDECCSFSWNKDACISAKPVEIYDPSPSADFPITGPTYSPPVQTPTPPQNNDSGNDNGNNAHISGSIITFTPVTGSFTCKAAGMACTIKCYQCGTIKRVASGMAVDFLNEYTIVYTAQRGTDYFPDDPSRLVLVESEGLAANIITCDEGCECHSVSESVMGCGLIEKPIGEYTGPLPSSPNPPLEISSGCAPVDFSFRLPASAFIWAVFMIQYLWPS
ncbi:hypothetical protein ACHAWF_008447 [Thalassiosira exigua]